MNVSGHDLGPTDRVSDGADPVRHIPGDKDELIKGTALCLSGGGYRAMLFHVGVLWRLNEAGRLRTLDRISSVSGGSITAGVLAKNWNALTFEGGVASNFDSQVVTPLRRMGHQSVDVSAVLLGGGLPFTSISDQVTKAYREHLFGDATLQDLPERPQFIINATNLESGVLMRFSKGYVADYRVGRVKNPLLPLAVAVAASSAFPPLLSPCTVDFKRETWTTDPGNDLTGDNFRHRVRLSDGGVYDNLGLETAWKKYKTVLVSDAGGRMKPDDDPATDWPRHLLRVLKVIDNQVRSLRKRQVIQSLDARDRDGMYIGIRSHVADYGVDDAMHADPELTDGLAAIPTRLDGLDDQRQELLINWGYTICDTGLRAHVDKTAPLGALPYPDRPLQRRPVERRS